MMRTPRWNIAIGVSFFVGAALIFDAVDPGTTATAVGLGLLLSPLVHRGLVCWLRLQARLVVSPAGIVASGWVIRRIEIPVGKIEEIEVEARRRWWGVTLPLKRHQYLSLTTFDKRRVDFETFWRYPDVVTGETHRDLDGIVTTLREMIK